MTTSAQVVACACGGRFQAPAQLAGRRVKCSACGQPIDVPALADSPLDSAGLAMQALPAANPLGKPAAAASSADGRKPLPLGLWIGLGVGGGALVLILVAVLGLWMSLQRMIAENRAQVAERAAAGQAAEHAAQPQAGPQLYHSPTKRFSVEFPGRPRQELVRSSERGGLSRWEAELTLGEFLQARGEQFLAIEQPLSNRLTDEKIEAALANLVNVTAHADDGRGRILTTLDISQPGYRGRDVTYEYTSKSGGRVSGRYRVLITDREIISIEWVAAPAKAQTDQVLRFFESFQMAPKE